MPEAFDLDDESYDPLGVGSRPVTPPTPPAVPPATPAEPPRSPASPGALPPSTQSLRPPSTARVSPTTTGGSTPTGSVPSRARHGDTSSLGGDTGPRTGEPTTGRPTQVGVPPHTKASDLLRGHPNYKKQESGDSKPMMPLLTNERTSTRFDDTVRWLLTASGIAAALVLIYYLFGLFHGDLSKEVFGPLVDADKQRIFANLDLAHNVMSWSLAIAVASMVYLFYDEASAAYLMVAVALVLQVIFPLLVTQYFDLAKTAPSDASQHMSMNAAAAAWIPGIPGIVLVLVEIARKFVSGLEEQKLKRRYLKYGQGQTAIKMDKPRNIFLGDCWNLPFCRDSIRAKCPIHLGRRGPCWRSKRGCMCDESIVLNASNADWKKEMAAGAESLASPASRLKGRVSAGPIVSGNQSLSMAFKKERCRQCVIYNTHQEHKYKALVFLAFVAVGFALYTFSGDLLQLVSVGYHNLDAMAAHLSFQGGVASAPSLGRHNAAAPAATPDVLGAGADLSGPVGWVLVIILTMVLLSNLLQAIEYVCFKLKI